MITLHNNLLFPSPFSGETIFSHLERIARVNLFSSFDKLARFFPDLEYGLQPRVTASLISRVAQHCNFTEDEYFGNHSINALYRLAISAPCGPRAERMFFNISRNDFYARRSIGRDVMHCIECDRASRAISGTTYLHRMHYIPGIEICPRHLVPLSFQRGSEILNWRNEASSAKRVRAPMDVIDAHEHPSVQQYRKLAVRMIRSDYRPEEGYIAIRISEFLSRFSLPLSVGRQQQVQQLLRDSYPDVWLRRFFEPAGDASTRGSWHYVNIRGYFGLLILALGK